MDGLSRCMIGIFASLCATIAAIAGMAVGRAEATRDMQRQALQYNHAHYDHDSGEFKWNNAPEKAP